MSSEMHAADWSIPYPDELNETGVSSVLLPLTHVQHDWHDFPWYLAPRLVGLLETPAATFEYFHVTVFFRARAAMLALTGDLLDRKEVFGALSRYRVQAGGIYRHVLMGYLRAFLARNNLVQLPECEQVGLDQLREHQQMEANRELIRRVIGFAEAEYISMLNFISLATDMKEVIGLHPVEFWVAGGERAAPIGVPVRTCRHEEGHDWTPGRAEAKAALLARRPVRKVAVRVQGELGGMVDGSWLMGGGASPAPAECGGTERTERTNPKVAKGPSTGLRAGPSTGLTVNWRVIGDFAMIVVPGAKGQIKLAGRWKARAFLRYLVGQLTRTGETEFLVEEMRDGFNAQFQDDTAYRRWVSDRFREDLFRGMEREFDVMFERLDAATGRYRIRG